MIYYIALSFACYILIGCIVIGLSLLVTDFRGALADNLRKGPVHEQLGPRAAWTLGILSMIVFWHEIAWMWALIGWDIILGRSVK